MRAAREVGRPLVATADVHYLRREDYSNHAALLCVQTKSTIEQPKLRFETNEFFLKSAAEMTESFSRWPEAVATTLEVAERCEVEIELGQLLLPRFPTPDGRGACRDAAAAGHRGPAPPLRGSGSGGGPREARVRALRDRGDGVRFLLPDRLGLRQVRQGQRHRRRPGARLRGGLDRRLLPQHHRPRPAGQRAALRALPQPGAQVDAGHRHRLLGPRSRAGDPLRGREVRARVGGADHHLRQDGASRGNPRRRPGARASTTEPATGSPSRSPSPCWVATQASRTASRMARS